MKLRGVDYGKLVNGSGARGFFGDSNIITGETCDWGYATFVTKTCTLLPNKGNETRDCIRTYPEKGLVLNAVGLSNPGIDALLKKGVWQSFNSPFIVSVGFVGKTEKERQKEAVGLSKRLREAEIAHMAVEVNGSCPNVSSLSSTELKGLVEQIATSERPVLLKISLEQNVDDIAKLTCDTNIDGVSLSNAIKWRSSTISFDWDSLSDSRSPLQHLGGGALSGAQETFEKVLSTTRKLVETMPKNKCVVAGGGIRCLHDAESLLKAGASAVSIWSLCCFDPKELFYIATTLT